MLYYLSVAFLNIFMRLFYNIQVHDRPHDFPKGQLIVSGNHSTWLDPIWIAITVPRRIHFLAKEELFRNPILSFLFTAAGFHPVKRGSADRRVLKFASQRLNEGRVVGIFPEGTRNKDGMGKAHNGAAYIALRTGSPILPVSIDYHKLGFRSVIHLRFQPVIVIKKDEKIDRQELERVTSQLMAVIASGLSHHE